MANDEGLVEIFDLNDKKLIGEIFIKPTLSAQGVMIPSKILSVDRLNGKTLIVSVAANGYRNAWMYEGNKTDRLIGHTAIPSTIKFFDEVGLFSAGYENRIFYWHLE